MAYLTQDTLKKGKDAFVAVAVLAFSLTLALGANYAFAVWTDPSATAPSNNVDAPINIGATTQTKLGNFDANVIGVNGLCLGTDCRTTWPDGGSSATSSSASASSAGSVSLYTNSSYGGSTYGGVAGLYQTASITITPPAPGTYVINTFGTLLYPGESTGASFGTSPDNAVIVKVNGSRLSNSQTLHAFHNDAGSGGGGSGEWPFFTGNEYTFTSASPVTFTLTCASGANCYFQDVRWEMQQGNVY